MKATDAAFIVLREAGEALYYQEITRRLLEFGLWETGGKTPEATLRAALGTDINRSGEASRFRRAGKGFFGLNLAVATEEVTSSLPAPAPPPAALAPKGSRPSSLSFSDAAEVVLSRFADRKPMHYREIADKAIELGLISTQGQTPEATLRAHIFREVERQEQRGERPRFTRHSKGYIGLSQWKGVDLASRIEQQNLEVRKKLHALLFSMPPADFEALVGELLVKLGFEQVVVTNRSNDGGIDVRGTLVVGDVIRTRMAVQVKRWKANVQAPIVQQVRGSLGAHEQGLIVSTSDFSPGARQEAARADATPVALMNGDEFVKLLMENEIGVRRSRLELFELVETGELIDETEDEPDECGDPDVPDPLQNGRGLDTLRAEWNQFVTGRKPQVLAFPDGTRASLSTWQDVAIQVVTWIGRNTDGLPLPFAGGHRGDRYLLNKTPDHKSEPMTYFVPLDLNGQTVYLHTKRSAREFVNYLCDLCVAVGQAPSGFVVSVK